MKVQKVADYQAMSVAGADVIYNAVVAAMKEGRNFNLGLATGNTMIELYRILAERFNADGIDLSRLQTWNLDEYASDSSHAVPHDHPLSYWKYMHENLFDRFAPERNFADSQAHFPDPADPAKFDQALADAGGLDLQLLGIGFNGHIAFNEPMKKSEIGTAEYGALPSRVLPLAAATIAQNTRLTAGGDETLMPRFAATMGMKQILASKQELLLACFAEQQEPLTRMIGDGCATPELPASYLLDHSDFTLIYTEDKINLDSVL